jgi:tetratricopeptide (TPR) repeat protein
VLNIVSGQREGKVVSTSHEDGNQAENEETILLEEIGECITRLFRVSTLIRQAGPTDLFAKALSRNRYQFNDQFDIAHVGEKYPKLANQFPWLQKRLGRAITQRRHYLSYIQDHREKLDGNAPQEDRPDATVPRSELPIGRPTTSKPLPDHSSSQPSTFITKASTLVPGQITTQILNVEENLDPEDETSSYTTISRTIDENLDASTTDRIPKLEEIRKGAKEMECQFCFRMKKFKNERFWRKHVFSDLRSYTCTFPNCDTPSFGDINEWFHHEMQTHRVSYVCQLCETSTFQAEERYLVHVRKQHPAILKESSEQVILAIARKSLHQIPAQECPCCSQWVDRLQSRAMGDDVPSDASKHILCVDPIVFKRHLASHLEELASFAIPIGSSTGQDVGSDVAIEQDHSARSPRSHHSILSFDTAPDRPTNSISEIEYSMGQRSGTDSAAHAPPSENDTQRESLMIPESDKISLQLDELLALDRITSEIEVLQDQLRDHARTIGPEYAETLSTLVELSHAYRNAGRWQAVEKLQRTIIEIEKKTLGEDHMATIQDILVLVTALKHLEQYKEAETLGDFALEQETKILGASHLNMAAGYKLMAEIYQIQGKIIAAEYAYNRALRCYTESPPPEDRTLLEVVSHLGDLYKELNRLDEAEEMYKRELRSYEVLLGMDDMYVLYRVRDLGRLYMGQGRWSMAEIMLRRALYGFEKHRSGDIADTANELAMTYARLDG